MREATEWFALGCRAFALRRHLHAERCYSRALASLPHWHNALQRRAEAWEELGRTREAIEDYRHALRTDPLCAWCWESLGNDLAKVGRYKDARQSIQKALNLRPRDSSLRYDLAGILLQLGLYQKAASILQSLRRCRGLGMLWREGRGRAFALLGRTALAQKDLDACVSMLPKAAETWFYRGLAKLKAGDKPGASKDLAKARKLGMRLPPLHKLEGKRVDRLLRGC